VEHWFAEELYSAETVKLYNPAVVGVPLMVVTVDVVIISSVNPGGKLPAVRPHVTGDIPNDSFSVSWTL